jgi:hypothetical protein
MISRIDCVPEITLGAARRTGSNDLSDQYDGATEQMRIVAAATLERWLKFEIKVGG